MKNPQIKGNWDPKQIVTLLGLESCRLQVRVSRPVLEVVVKTYAIVEAEVNETTTGGDDGGGVLVLGVIVLR